MKCGVTAGIICLVCASQAHAIQQCRPTKKDPRICEFTYASDDISEIWGAPGTAQLIELAPDEEVKKVRGADSKHLVASWSDNMVTLKYRGCLVEQPLFVFAVKGDEQRHYVFQVETRPRACEDPDNPDKSPTHIVEASLGSKGAVPDLKHLEHDDDLAAGGSIPYKYRFAYPGDERAKRQAAWRAAAKAKQSKEGEAFLNANAGGTGYLNKYYWGRGDARLQPVSPDPRTPPASDNGDTTTIYFAGNIPIPIFTKPDKPEQHCGPNAGEAATDISTTGSKVTIAGTAQSYCLRSADGAVYELWNSGYSRVGHPPGTGTSSPYAERVVKGAD